MTENELPPHTAVLCADFYRPVVAALVQAGFDPLGRYYPPNSNQDFHSGWRGRWRSFKTGYEDLGLVYYCEVGIRTGDTSAVGLDIRHPDLLALSDFLYAHVRSCFHGISLTTNQPTKTEGGLAYISLSRPGTVRATSYQQERTREWMSASLIALRDRIDPLIAEALGQRS